MLANELLLVSSKASEKFISSFIEIQKKNEHLAND